MLDVIRRISLPLLLVFLGTPGSGAEGPHGPVPLSDREKVLLDRIEQLERRLLVLEKAVLEKDTAQRPAAPAPLAQTPSASANAVIPASAASPGSAAQTPSAPAGEADSGRQTLLGFASGSTLNMYLDGYYGWNFNRPVGRVNLLRANDVTSDNFTLNQMALILERTPDVAAGRRYGARVDLMFGQNTETLQGGAQNEPRPQVYRNIFQAYGTYVLPVGSGLTVDFGKFYSALGFENNYAYDEVNYSRSFYFNYLPFYHAGLRATYNFNDKLSMQYWLVNGANQTEDFNDSKSNAFLFTVKPVKTVSWNVNYYFGQESRDVVPAYNPGVPTLPTQPGLSVTPVPGPRLNGKTHIFDTYASWSPNDRLTLAGELDHVVSRFLAGGPPSHVSGGAAYAQYHFTPRFSLSGRFEYLQDHGGLFSGRTQALKEHTFTLTYQPLDGVQMRAEYRRDFSNQPFFLTDLPGYLKKEQNTATLGLIWWFGGKPGSW